MLRGGIGKFSRLPCPLEACVRAPAARSPEFCTSMTLREVGGRREDRGKTGWPLQPGILAQKEIARARKPQVQAGTSGLPCAVVLRLICALPGEPSRLPPSPPRSFSASLETWRQISGAPGPHDFVVRKGSPLVSQRPHVHRIPASRVVTTAIRPSAYEAGSVEDTPDSTF